jgi:membrane protein implicated in regulation of membrane protease activity
MKNFFSNRYYHLGIGLIAILAGVKIWMQPAGNFKMLILVSIVILLVVARSIYRFMKLK